MAGYWAIQTYKYESATWENTETWLFLEAVNRYCSDLILKAGYINTKLYEAGGVSKQKNKQTSEEEKYTHSIIMNLTSNVKAELILNLQITIPVRQRP